MIRPCICIRRKKQFVKKNSSSRYTFKTFHLNTYQTIRYIVWWFSISLVRFIVNPCENVVDGTRWMVYIYMCVFWIRSIKFSAWIGGEMLLAHSVEARSNICFRVYFTNEYLNDEWKTFICICCIDEGTNENTHTHCLSLSLVNAQDNLYIYVHGAWTIRAKKRICNCHIEIKRQQCF